VLQVLRSPGDVFRVVASAAWPVGSVSFVVQCEFRELPAVLHILVAREPPAESMQRSMAATRYGRPACLAMCVISVAGTWSPAVCRTTHAKPVSGSAGVDPLPPWCRNSWPAPWHLGQEPVGCLLFTYAWPALCL